MGVEWAKTTAVVTGAGSGIGRALALELARRGAALALSDIDRDRVEATARRCRAAGSATAPTVSGYVLDVADRSAVQSHAAEVVADFGAVHMLVNNAGVGLSASVLDTPFEDLDWLLGINLGGVVNGSKAFLPHLIASGDGHLVNISSVFGFVAPPHQAAYSASKFAVRGFTEALNQEMIAAGLPVKVHCVHPGGVRTSIAAAARYPRGPGRPPADPVLQAATFDKVARTSPDTAARTILRGVERGRARILVGLDAYVIDGVSRLLGPLYIGILGRAARRVAD